MSSSLEDYLETIYLLVQEHGFARVKDIARARDVKAATVSIALRRLAEANLVDYERREYIGLTAKGESAARRVLTRHRLLTRFFSEVLRMAPAAASEQACAMEHSLTDEAMDRLVRIFEFLGSCPAVTDAFRTCPVGLASASGPGLPVHSGGGGAAVPGDGPGPCETCTLRCEVTTSSVADLRPGQRAVVTQIHADGPLRQRLLDMGILPETGVELLQGEVGSDSLLIRCQGASLPLGRLEASAIRVRKAA